MSELSSDTMLHSEKCRVYVSTSRLNWSDARRVATELAECGFAVVSTWHCRDMSVPMSSFDECWASVDAFSEIAASDVLVLLCGAPDGAEDATREAFYAVGCGKRVVAVRVGHWPGLPSSLRRHDRATELSSPLESVGVPHVGNMVRATLREVSK